MFNRWVILFKATAYLKHVFTLTVLRVLLPGFDCKCIVPKFVFTNFVHGNEKHVTDAVSCI